MKFRNYCIIIMGKTEGCKLEIGKIAEGSPRFLDAKGITIATFVSIAEPAELSDYFKQMDRNFMIFDTDSSVSGFNLTNEKLYNALFGHLNDELSIKLEEMSNKLIDDIKSTNEKQVSGNTSQTPEVNLKLTEIKVESKIRYRKEALKEMRKKDRDNILNEILDKGVENLTEHDKEILEFLSKIS